ncbi:augmin complex subunit dgt6-like isoform X3 [Hermetia illucens]|nr:augmin complex subunit dgt6-like isoform X3 [Hermetia illucens]
MRKAEERDLSEQIHRNLQLLNIMYPRNFEFNSCFTQDMFLRPNTKAFPYVMHYLFNILDPIEFKKRFYWPLDRTSENAFRTTTVQYLNHLNEKHNLGWGEIKVFLVVMPGGMKFMKLLSDLINFVVDEETKKVEKSLPDNITKRKLTLTNDKVQGIVRSHEKFMREAVRYKEKVDAQKSILRENAKILGDKLNEICQQVSMTPEQLDEAFLQKFAFTNYNLFEKTIISQANETEATEKYLDRLSSEIDKFHSEKHQFPCDKDLLMSSYKTIQNDYPGLCPKGIITVDNKIQLESLFEAFNCIFPALEEACGQCDVTTKKMDKYEFEVNEVAQLQNDATQLDNDIFKFESIVDEIKVDLEDLTKSGDSEKLGNTPSRSNIVAENCIKSKYLFTPAIYVQNDNACKARLPLLEDNGDKSFSFANQTTVYIPKSGQAKNISFGGHSSKIIDPHTLLRTVTKSAKRRNQQQRFNQSNLSLLASKFRENENMFAKEKENISQTVIGTDFEVTPIKSTQSNSFIKETIDRHNVIKEKFVENRVMKLTPESLIFQKRQRTSIHEIDLNSITKSPSGRLDSLIRVNFEDFSIPEILVNDLPITKSELIEEHEIEVKPIAIPKNTEKSDCTRQNGDDDKENQIDNVMNEFCADFQKKLGINLANESISNVSDSILKDISFETFC